MRFPKLALALGAALCLAACATLPPEIPDSAALSECRGHFLMLDQQTAGDGLRDAGAWRIPGFPYLRTNRFLSSFSDGLDAARFPVWVEHLRRFGLESRASELRNLGEDDVARELQQLDRCGAAWAQRDLSDPQRRLDLRRLATVPDDYATWKRIVGLYAFSSRFLKLGIGRDHAAVREDFARPLDQLDAPGPLVLWRPAGVLEKDLRSPALALGAAPADGGASAREIAWWLANPAPDALGIPHLGEEQWWRMALAHAPSWWVESAGDYDRPGRVGLKDGAPVLDPGEPVTYFLPSFTRFGGRVLPQLVYVLWFPERPKQGAFDAYAGWLDGLVWRVTLDSDGSVLAYDTIHPCGCFHKVFPVKPLKRRPADGSWLEDVIVPQPRAPAQNAAIRIQSATHYVRRVVDAGQASGDARTYQLLDYRELLSLADGADGAAEGHGRRSMFCADGLVCGSERAERFWLWISGIDSPGAMRQWGRHATAFVGRRHFDDADLLERLFIAPL